MPCEFRPIANPYIVGNPIEDPRMFFGREDDFSYIKQKTTGQEKGGLFVLCGGRRSGKTSILFQVKRGRLGERFLPVLIDMQSITVRNDAEFLAKLAKEVAAAASSPALDFATDYEQAAQANPELALTDFVAKAVDVTGGRKLLLMFDEYELFESLFDSGKLTLNILRRLASLIESDHGVFIIFTGSEKLNARAPRFWKEFLPKAQHRHISFLSESDAMRLIHEPLRGLAEYAEGVPARIFALTAGQPFYTQVLCQNLADQLNERRTSLITEEALETGVASIIENPLPQMIFAWGSLGIMEKLLLSILADMYRKQERFVDAAGVLAYPQEERMGCRLDPALAQEGLERLFHQDLLVKDADGQRFGYKMGLWRLWIARMHSVWQVVDEIGGMDHPSDGILPAASRRRRPLAIALAGTALIVVAAAALQWNRPAPLLPTAPDSAFVRVSTDPPGAQVFLGDRLLGLAPVDRVRVAAGRAVARAQVAGFHPQERFIDIPADSLLDVHFALAELTGSLLVTSEPQGAKVAIAGLPGDFVTPVTIEGLSANRLFDVVLKMPGRQDGAYAKVAVRADEVTEVSHSFVSESHQLRIVSRPAGAEVTVDDAPQGVTPALVQGVAAGRHRLLVRMADYAAFDSTIVVPHPGGVFECVLRALPPGKIVFSVIPWAELYINGELKASNMVHREFELKAGAYACELRHPDFATHAVTIVLEPAETETVTFNFAGLGARP